MMTHDLVKGLRVQFRNDDTNQKEEGDRKILRKKNYPN
jgi:hypothetical protein